MPVFELAFELPPIDETIEDRVVEHLDALISGHHGVMTATVTVDAPDCLTAAARARSELARLGAAPVRLVDDVVSRSEIAERAGVTRQAVGLWLSGARQQTLTFPGPLVLSGGGLWLWGELVPVLRAMNIDPDPGIEFPTRRDSAIINGLLASRAFDAATSFSVFAFAEQFTVTPGSAVHTFAMSAPEKVQTDFNLAA